MASGLSNFVAAGLLALALGTALPDAAAQAPAPRVDYAGDWHMETAEGTMVGKVYHAGGLERRELNEGGERIVMIMRPDKKLMWNLMPNERMYMETALGKDKARKDDLGQYDIEQSVVGEETVDGRRTTKSKIIMKEKKPGGGKLGGFWWMSRDGIIVKMDMLAIDQGSKERIKMELTNLQVGKQDPKLFEIPPGYEKAGGMGGLGKMMMGGGGKDDDDKDDDKPAKGQEKKEGFGLKDALKILR